MVLYFHFLTNNIIFQGRFVVAGHHNYFFKYGNVSNERAQLSSNVVRWAIEDGGINDSSIIASNNHMDVLGTEGQHTLRGLNAAQLDHVQLYAVTTRVPISENDANNLVKYVKRGGGLLVCAEYDDEFKIKPLEMWATEMHVNA